MFLAGDAAHIHSPFGGQGMNTGLHDAWNLAWKIDFFLRGLGTEPLLDSYGAERLPVIRHVVGMTDLMTKVMGTPNRLVQALRNSVIPMVSRLVPFQHAFIGTLSELDIAYPDSPIVEGPGRRYLDDSMRGGTGIRNRFLLFVGEDGGPSVKEAARRLCESLSEVVECRPERNGGVTLVRPDGYVAFESRDGGADAIALARGVLERQTTRTG
jgi:hypothetical protein